MIVIIDSIHNTYNSFCPESIIIPEKYKNLISLLIIISYILINRYTYIN